MEPAYEGIEELLPKVMRTLPQVFPVTTKQMPANNKYSQCHIQISWRPTEMMDLE